MSALGQKRTLQCIHVMSAEPPKADIRINSQHIPADVITGSLKDILTQDPSLFPSLLVA